MQFKVFRISALSQLDSLPVAVIKDYPLEKRDYKPYAQCNICLDDHTLFIRMWAFEVSPPEGSELRGVFYLFPDKSGMALAVSMRPNGGCDFFLLEDGKQRAVNPPQGFVPHPHNGEDLQGVYWGGLAALPFDWLQSLDGKVSLGADESFLGNFYKLCPGPAGEHKGSFFPADFLGDAYNEEGMGEFLMVSY